MGDEMCVNACLPLRMRATAVPARLASPEKGEPHQANAAADRDGKCRVGTSAPAAYVRRAIAAGSGQVAAGRSFTRLVATGWASCDSLFFWPMVRSQR